MNEFERRITQETKGSLRAGAAVAGALFTPLFHRLTRPEDPMKGKAEGIVRTMGREVKRAALEKAVSSYRILGRMRR